MRSSVFVRPNAAWAKDAATENKDSVEITFTSTDGEPDDIRKLAKHVVDAANRIPNRSWHNGEDHNGATRPF